MNLKLRIDDDLIKYLEYEEPMFNGVHYVFDFENGYGASVIKHMGSYGHLRDEWEVACMFNGNLSYPELMDGDVLGYLSDEEVNRLLRLIRDKKLDKFFYDVEEEVQNEQTE